MTDADVIIIGSGIGGASVAASLARSGLRVLVLERGRALCPSPEDRDAGAIFRDGHFRPDENWLDGGGRAFSAGNYYTVGGNSKFYGAVFLRYREADFSPIQHMGGRSPGWPMSYDTLAPYYDRAEALFQLRGDAGLDPSDPPRGNALPFPPVPHEPDIAEFARRMSAVGMTPSPLPLAVDLPRWMAGGQTPWDAFPNTRGGKVDAETVLSTAMTSQNLRLKEAAHVVKLHTQPDGQITGVALQDGTRLTAKTYVLAAGAVQTAALLLKSQNDAYPTGLANGSDQVGRNFMNHNCSAVMALHPLRRNRSVYQKTLMLNDFYETGGPNGAPLGNVQLLGKISDQILDATTQLPKSLCRWIANRSIDLYAMSEDLPNPDSRVTLRNGQVVLDWKRSNWDAHRHLVKTLKRKLRQAGYPIVLSRAFDRRTPSHQCGTARMGQGADTSVVNPHCQCHQHANLYIADASVLPTSAAVNPALTIAALGIRVADHIIENSKNAQSVRQRVKGMT